MEKLSYIAFIFLGVSGTVHGMALPFLIERFSLSLSLAGLIFFSSSIGYLLASSTFPATSRIFTARRLLSLGMLVVALSFFILPVTPAWSMIIILAFVASLGIGTIDVGFNALIAGLEPSRAKPAMNILHFSYAVGALVGPLVLSRLLTLGFDWNILYFFTASLFLFSMLHWRSKSVDIELSTFDNESSKGAETPYSHSSFWLLVIAMFVYCGAEVSLVGWISTYFTTELSLGPENASIGISILWLGLALGRGLCSRISNLLSTKNLLLILNIGSAIVLGLFILLNNLWLAFTCLFLIGLFFSAIFPNIMLHATVLFPHAPSKISSGLVTSAGLGALIIPSLLGFIGEVGNLRLGILMLAVLMVISTVCVFVVQTKPSLDYAKTSTSR